MYCTPDEVRDIGTQLTDTALPEDVLESLILRASRMFDLACGVEPGYFEASDAPYALWEALHAYVVGDVVTPTTLNGHSYIVTTAGTSGASEPTWPLSGTVADGTVVFTEDGAGIPPVARTIYGDGTNYLRIPPYHNGTLAGTVTVPTGYTAPSFIATGGYLVRAVDGVVQRGYPQFDFGWWQGVAVTVSAVWGYEATPEDVKAAVIELVINLFRETDPAFIKLINIEGQPLREKMPPRVAEAIRRYRPKLTVAFV